MKNLKELNIEQIADGLDCLELQAVQIYNLVHEKVSPENSSEFMENWVKNLFHSPSKEGKMMEAFNEILGGYGPISLNPELDWEYSHRPPDQIVNMGGPYIPTIACRYDRDGDFLGFFTTSQEEAYYNEWKLLFTRQVGMFPGRHPLEVEEYIFTKKYRGSPKEFPTMKSEAKSFLDNLDPEVKEVQLFVTGLTVGLVAVVHTWLRLEIPVTLKLFHYEKVDGIYVEAGHFFPGMFERS